MIWLALGVLAALVLLVLGSIIGRMISTPDEFDLTDMAEQPKRETMRQWLGTEDDPAWPWTEDAPVEFAERPSDQEMQRLSHVHIKGRCVKRRHGRGPCNRSWT